MSTAKSLIKYSEVNANSRGNNGSETIVSVPTLPRAAARNGNSAHTPAVLSDELVERILKGHGLRSWLRAARVTQVLGCFHSIFFWTATTFAQTSTVAWRLPGGYGSRQWATCSAARADRNIAGSMLDKVIRVLRLLVFRGAEGSSGKAARLEKQAVWLRDSLIGLGPTFIKIGQALGTRADLLPLAYVKELSTLQDQVPAFPTADAFSRIESELGHPLHECYSEIDHEPVASASLGQVLPGTTDFRRRGGGKSSAAESSTDCQL